MKKFALLLAILLILSCVSGCGASASTQEDDGALQQQVVDLQEENATLKQQVADLQKENSSLQQQIEALQKPVEDASSAENIADYEAQESIESSVEETTSDAETFDVSETEIRGGTNQAEAMQLPMNTKVYGTLHDAQSMYLSFHTGPRADSTYLVTVVNKTPMDNDRGRIGIYVFDELGTEIADGSAYDSGIASTLSVEGLSPDTDYYIRLIVQNRGNDGTEGDTVGYALTVRCQNNTPEANTATVEDAEEVVFETPFELSSTQVRFVADQAVFINENEAKEALAPVAEIILAHPEHPILLAGTTATYGAQESCVNLSNRRAAAVKDLLVNYFGVPESQLITVGLGYEADPFVRGRDVDSNGNFVETEGAKNRRVVVLDAESDIARQILGN